MNFTDMHIHLQDYKANCATDIIENARAAGVGRMVCAATAESDWPAVVALAEKYPHTVVPAFGVHPWYAGETAAGWEHRLHKRLLSAPEALVGESGLDGLRGDQAAQKTVFSVQAALAKELRRPLVIHAVKAVAALSAFLPQMPERFMIHSFNGRTEHLRPILNAGGYVSFSASILKNRDAGEIVRLVPEDRLLIETDGPYQGPEKGREQTPLFLPVLLAQLARWRREDAEKLAAAAEANAKEFIYGK